MFILIFINLEIDEIRRMEEEGRKKKEAYENEIHRLEEHRKSQEEAYEKRRKILKWLSSDDFEETHDRNFKKRFENTGQWLLDDLRFRNWRDGAQSSLLWCYGARKSQLYNYIYMITSNLLQLAQEKPH